MLKSFKNDEMGLTLHPQPIHGSWINVINPSPEDISNLEAMGIPRDYITYPLDLDERARTEREDGNLLIVLRIPYFQGAVSDVPYITIPLGILLTDQYIITVCKYDNEILQEFSSGKVRGLSTSKRQRFLLRLLWATANKYLLYLREIDKVVDALEDQLQKSIRNKEVLELLKYQKSLTYFTTALKTNELMMERLQRSQLFKTYPEDEELLEDVLTENQQAIEMTNISSSILSSMMDAFASIISNNVNAIMKFMASITIVLSVPPIIFGLFGMNVDLPFASQPLAFLFVLLITAAIVVPVVVLFYKRDWF